MLRRAVLMMLLIVAGLNYTSVQPGSTSGLRVVLHVNQSDYLYAASSSAGFRVYTENLQTCLNSILFRKASRSELMVSALISSPGES